MIVLPTAHVLPAPAAEALQRAHEQAQSMAPRERELFLDEVIRRIRSSYPERFRAHDDEVRQ